MTYDHQQTTAPAWMARLLSYFPWLALVNRETLRVDVVAGLTGAIVVLPQGVAFAAIAGMPPEYGLYAGMVPAIIAALFGSSWHLVSGPTTAASIVLFSALSVHATPGTAEYVTLALTLTFIVGLVQLALGLARMGALVNFISHSVIVGFTAGAAVLIAAKQLKYFFGVEIPRGGHLHDIVFHFGSHIAEINLWVTLVSLATLGSGIALRRWLPRFPYMIGAMVFGSLVSVVLTALLGETAAAIPNVGALPQSLPPLSAPELNLSNLKDLAPAAFAVTMFALTEAVSIGRSIAIRSGQRIDGNRAFIAQGLSNIAGSFFSGYVATGSFNRSGLNFQAGARTPVAAILAGALLIVIVIMVAPLAAYLPKAAMAGILFLVAWGLIDFREIRHILHSSRRETAVMSVTFFGALLLELEIAIFAGVLLSLILYLERVSRPKILTRVPDPRLPGRKFNTDPDLPECPQVRFLRVDGALFFGSVNHLQETFARTESQFPEQRHLAVIAHGINFVDIAGADALAQEARKRKARGGGLYMIGMKEGLWDPLERCGTVDEVGPGNLFQSKSAAIESIYHRLDKAVCARCSLSVFRECPKGRTG